MTKKSHNEIRVCIVVTVSTLLNSVTGESFEVESVQVAIQPFPLRSIQIQKLFQQPNVHFVPTS